MGLHHPEDCALARGGRMAEVVSLDLSPKTLGLKSCLVQAWILLGGQFLGDSSSSVRAGPPDRPRKGEGVKGDNNPSLLRVRATTAPWGAQAGSKVGGILGRWG